MLELQEAIALPAPHLAAASTHPTGANLPDDPRRCCKSNQVLRFRALSPALRRV